jgi:hypothetical protein
MIIGRLMFIETWMKEGFETPTIWCKFDLGFVVKVPPKVLSKVLSLMNEN